MTKLCYRRRIQAKRLLSNTTVSASNRGKATARVFWARVVQSTLKRTPTMTAMIQIVDV